MNQSRNNEEKTNPTYCKTQVDRIQAEKLYESKIKDALFLRPSSATPAYNGKPTSQQSARFAWKSIPPILILHFLYSTTVTFVGHSDSDIDTLVSPTFAPATLYQPESIYLDSPALISMAHARTHMIPP